MENFAIASKVRARMSEQKKRQISNTNKWNKEDSEK